MESFRTISEMMTVEGMIIAVVCSEKSYDRYLVHALDGPNAFLELFRTEGATPADRELAEKVMKAAHIAVEEAELRAELAGF